MQVTVQDIRTGRTRTMDKKFADILVKLKKFTYDIQAEGPSLGPVYNTSMMKAKIPVDKKVAKEKKPKKSKEKKEPKSTQSKVSEPELTLTKEPSVEVEKKEYQTKVMTAGD